MKKNAFLSGIMTGMIICIPLMIIVGYLLFEESQPKTSDKSTQTRPQTIGKNNRPDFTTRLSEPKTPQEMLNFLDKIIAARPREAAAHLAKAGILSELGDYAQALKNYDAAIAINPSNAQSYMGRAVAKFMLGDMAGAQKDFSLAIQLDPQMAQAYYNRGIANLNLARLLLAERDFTKARDLFLQAQDNSSYNDAARALKLVQDYQAASRAPVQSKQNKKNRSNSALSAAGKNPKELISIKRSGAPAQQEVSKMIANMRTNKGLFSIEEFNWDTPKNTDNTTVLTDMSSYENTLRKILSEKTKPAAKQQPREKTASDYRRDAQNKAVAKDYKGALQDLDKAMSLSPEDTGLYMDRADIYARQNDAVHALEELDKVLKSNPDNAQAHLLKSEMLSLLGKRAQALEAAKKAKEFFKAQGNKDGEQRAQNEINRQEGKELQERKRENKLNKIYTQASNAYVNGNFKEAYDKFKELYNLNPDPGNAYNIALTAARLNNFDEASKYFKEAQKSKIPAAFSADANISIQQGEYNKAKQTINEGMKICPQCPDIHSSDAMNKSSQGDYEGAIKASSNAIKYAGEKPNATDYLVRAQAYLNLEDFGENFGNVNETNVGVYAENVKKAHDDFMEAEKIFNETGDTKMLQEIKEKIQLLSQISSMLKQAQGER
jgi:tetratricopeptide (TPR) repeat protein